MAVVAIRGELDTSGVSRLGALFGAVIASGYRSVVLDVAALELVDLALLQVIGYAASQIVGYGGEVRIWSPRVMVTRTLDISWLGESVSLDLPSPASDHLGPEQSASECGRADDGERPVDASRRVSRSAADDRALDGSLRLVVELARISIVGADGVSVSLRRHGRLATVAASNDTIAAMDLDQYTTGEGPCVDASVNGHWFHAQSLDHETRWPSFTPRAKSLGINAILSNPLMAHGCPVGALNIYSRSPAAFSVKEQEVAAAFATEASLILADAGAGVSDDERASSHRDALESREVIALAQGVIMVREGVEQELASAALRRAARRSGRTMRELAQEVVASARWSEARSDPSPRGSTNPAWSAGDLEQERRHAGISRGELWLRYFGLGGMCTELEVEAFVLGAARPSAHDHDLIAQALSERHFELEGQ